MANILDTPITLTTLRNLGAVAALLVSVGIGWSKLHAQLAQKVDKSEFDNLARAFQAAETKATHEQKVNRYLLCRIPEIRSDSNCDGFRHQND